MHPHLKVIYDVIAKQSHGIEHFLKHQKEIEMKVDELTTQLQAIAGTLESTQAKLEGVPAAIAAQAEASAAALAALQAEIAAAEAGEVSEATVEAVSKIQAANDALSALAATLAPAQPEAEQAG